MSTDLSQFYDVFYEESFELLENMEASLLELTTGSTNPELIHTIFRAAHSIKGGAGTFGFTQVAEFTHVMETLLDEMREGKRTASMEVVGLLLESGDAVRGMLEALRDSQSVDDQHIASLLERLNAQLNSPDASVETTPPGGDSSAVTSQSEEQTWQIIFRPHKDLMKTGNDPLRLLRELDALGNLEISADMSALPDFRDMDPEECHLKWALELKGDIDLAQIEEIFEWVEGDCELEIQAIGGSDAVSQTGAGSESGPTVEQEVVAPPVQTAGSEVTASEQSNPDVSSGVKAAATDKAGPSSRKTSSGEGGSIRVGIDKIDALINQVGELVITQSMLSQIGACLEGASVGGLDKLRDGLTQLERNTRDLQESVLQVRMLPINVSFSRFPRLVHDLSNKMGKKVELRLSGEQTEVDKTVLEKIGDPLVHLVRNSLDHGLEMPEVRKEAGKPETGVLELSAFHEGSDVVIEVIDDGAGLNKYKILRKAIDKGIVAEGEDLSDERIHNLIFQPGFSTADQVSNVSGRGVGMDVVRRNIRDLGGNVSIRSDSGRGSKITIRLPLTLAILDGQLISVGNQTYIISLVSIIESLQVKPERLKSITGQAELYKLRGEYIPIIRLYDLFGMEPGTTNLQQGLLVIVEAEGTRAGLFVDDLMGQQQVVIKSLETNFRHIQGISGATILGDGTVALIMDVPGLIQRHFDECNRDSRQITAVA